MKLGARYEEEKKKVEKMMSVKVQCLRALSLLIGVFQRIVIQSFSSTIFGRSSYQSPFVSMFYSCSLHIPPSRHFDSQVFIYREILNFFRWPIYV